MAPANSTDLRALLTALACAFALGGRPALAAGHYVGDVVAKWDPDGRTMELTAPYSYFDSSNQEWPVPAGAQVDGASIPQAAWAFIGGPFEGKYRNASVIHDWYCDRRTRRAREVHRVFYDAMLTSGVDEFHAKLLYAAVARFGPQWNDQAIHNNQLADQQGQAPGIVLQAPAPSKPINGLKRPSPNRTPTRVFFQLSRQETEVVLETIDSLHATGTVRSAATAKDIESLSATIRASNPSLDEIDKIAAAGRIEANLRAIGTNPGLRSTFIRSLTTKEQGGAVGDFLNLHKNATAIYVAPRPDAVSSSSAATAASAR